MSSQFLNSNTDMQTIPYLETEDTLAETDIEIADTLNNCFAKQSTV